MIPEILQAATTYAKNGFSIIPIVRGDKRPAVAWEQYQTRRATSDEVDRWFADGQYESVGIITGAVSNGLVILDFDGEGWEQARDELFGRFPKFLDTLQVRTGSGKLHVYLCAEDITNGDGEPITRKVYKRPDLGKDTAIELRGNSMQTLAPPSIHPSGGRYEFMNDGDIIRLVDLHSLTDWLGKWQVNKREEKTEKHKAPTDDELAMRWIESGDRFAYGMNDWRRYSEGYWPVVAEEEAKLQVLRVCAAAKHEGIRTTSARIGSVIELARLLTFVNADRWDAVSDVLVFANGTLNLKTFELQPHDLSDYATRAIAYEYDEAAEMPHFDYVLHSTIPDACDFLQEFAGYCLTVDTSLETAIWFYGPPGSGKSTILHGIATMMGDMVGHLSLQQIERSQFSLADLPGKRLVMSTEQPSMYVKSTGVLNAIISGETVPIERKNKPVFTITPQAKLMFAMNDLPRISDASNGLFRRVKVLQFPALDSAARDESLKRLISKEGPGIMNWALEGLRRLRERGRFDIPDCVTTATGDFQRENDKAALFVLEKCIRGNDLRVQSQPLYNAYREWCFENGHKPASSTVMAREWRRLGFDKKRIAGKTWWQNVGFAIE